MSTAPPGPSPATGTPALALSARRVYVATLVRVSAGVPPALTEVLQQALSLPAEPKLARKRQDALAQLQQQGAIWQMGLIRKLRQAQPVQEGQAPRPLAVSDLTLVGDDAIQREIQASRLALSVDTDTQWQFTDLRSRVLSLEGRKQLDSHDLLRPEVLAHLWTDAWNEAELGHAAWSLLQEAIEQEFNQWMGCAFHDTNRWLIEQGVMTEVDLRPFIRRSRGVALGSALGSSFLASNLPGDAGLRGATVLHTLPGVTGFGAPAGGLLVGGVAAPPTSTHASQRPLEAPLAAGDARTPTDFHATQPSASAGPALHATEVMAQLQDVLRKQVPALAADPSPVRQAPLRAEALVQASPRLQAVIQRAQEALRRPAASATASPNTGSASGPSSQVGASSQTPAASTGSASAAALDEVRARSQAFKQVLKQAAASPEERATIEIVAMMFQSILQEERLPPAIRVWFARLQMPVLRVAVVEPDFFAANNHPARQLIDRLGACVLGFDASEATLGDALDHEIKRIVQVIEAYPDTGRRVFQTVLTEFEHFLSNFFAKDNPASREGISIAQQIEQRETLAIQYTIELRKMLADLPVDEQLRRFLFQVWADVLAVTAMRAGGQSDTTRNMKRAAADLIWSAGAKSSPEERADVIRRLPLLLKVLREGMGHAGVPQKKQDEHIRKLNGVLATAFTAKAAPVSQERLDELMDRLQTLESMLPNLSDIDIDEDLVRDLSDREHDGMEVVSEGGSPPSPAMLAWARELAVGGWYQLQLHGQTEQVQLAWVGAKHVLLLFVTAQGRAILFPQHRLASYLQAGLLQPAQEESLTVKATRDALARLEGDPEALLRH